MPKHACRRLAGSRHIADILHQRRVAFRSIGGAAFDGIDYGRGREMADEGFACVLMHIAGFSGAATAAITQPSHETQQKRATDFFARGNSYAAKGQYDRAIADYNEAIRLDPKDETPRIYRERTLKNAVRQ